MAEPRAVPLFRQRSFAALWWGQLVSILGERLTYLALVGLLASHTSQLRDPSAPMLLSVLANVMLAPVLLLSPFAGAWVDRWNLKRVMVVSDLLRAVLVALIPVLEHLTHHTAPAFALVFGLYTCNVFFLPAKSALTPEIVPPTQLLAANSLLIAAGLAATAGGALAGGWFIDRWGWAPALYANAVTYLVSVAAIALIPYDRRRHEASLETRSVRDYLGEVSQGWRLMLGNPRVGLALTAMAAVWIGGGFLHVAGNPHLQRAAAHPGMERLGVLLAVLGAGSGIATWAVNRSGVGIPRSRLVGFGLLLAGAGVALFALTERTALFALAAFVVGVGLAPAFTLGETLLQEGTGRAQRGRIFSVRDFIVRLAFWMATLAAGAVSHAFGLPAALLLCAVFLAAVGVIAFSWQRVEPDAPARS